MPVQDRSDHPLKTKKQLLQIVASPNCDQQLEQKEIKKKKKRDIAVKIPFIYTFFLILKLFNYFGTRKIISFNFFVYK